MKIRLHVHWAGHYPGDVIHVDPQEAGAILSMGLATDAELEDKQRVFDLGELAVKNVEPDASATGSAGGPGSDAADVPQ